MPVQMYLPAASGPAQQVLDESVLRCLPARQIGRSFDVLRDGIPLRPEEVARESAQSAVSEDAAYALKAASSQIQRSLTGELPEEISARRRVIAAGRRRAEREEQAPLSFTPREQGDESDFAEAFDAEKNSLVVVDYSRRRHGQCVRRLLRDLYAVEGL